MRTLRLRLINWLQGLSNKVSLPDDDLGACPECGGRLKFAWEPMSARCDTCDYFE